MQLQQYGLPVVHITFRWIISNYPVGNDDLQFLIIYMSRQMNSTYLFSLSKPTILPSKVARRLIWRGREIKPLHQLFVHPTRR